MKKNIIYDKNNEVHYKGVRYSFYYGIIFFILFFFTGLFLIIAGILSNNLVENNLREWKISLFSIGSSLIIFSLFSIICSFYNFFVIKEKFKKIKLISIFGLVFCGWFGSYSILKNKKNKFLDKIDYN